MLSKLARNYLAEAEIDGDEALRSGRCNCNFFQQNKLRQGPCEHILALRKAYVSKETNKKI